METEVTTSQSTFGLRFLSGTNEIDSGTLGRVLVGISTLFDIANSEFNGDAQLDMKVRATRSGSFIADLALNIVPAYLAVQPLISIDNIKSAAELFKMVAEILKLKKELNDSPVSSLEKANDKYVLRNNNTVSIYNIDTVNLYVQKPQIAIEASQIGAALESNESLKGFELTNDMSGVEFEATEKEFKCLSSPPGQDDITTKERIVTRTGINLLIVSLAFENDLVSRFLYLGSRIIATINDDNFYNDIDNGLKISKGDSLVVDMNASQTWEEHSQVFVDSKHYEITKVIKHIPRENVRQLPLPE